MYSVRPVVYGNVLLLVFQQFRVKFTSTISEVLQCLQAGMGVLERRADLRMICMPEVLLERGFVSLHFNYFNISIIPGDSQGGV